MRLIKIENTILNRQFYRTVIIQVKQLPALFPINDNNEPQLKTKTETFN